MNKRNYSIAINRQKITFEKVYTPVMYRALREQKQIVLREVRKHGPITALIYIDKISSEPLIEAYRKLYKNVGGFMAKQEWERLQKIPEEKRFGFVIDWLADIATFLDDYLLDKVIRPMTALTMERMRAVLTNGIATGESYDQMVKKLADTELDKVRARLISRTEVNRATNFASSIAAKAYPFVIRKEWLSARDKRTRGNPIDGKHDQADHWDLNGVQVAEGEAFTDPRNGAQMMVPGDSTLGAPAVSIVNCRCNSLNIPQRGADGRLIRKPV